MYSEYCNIIVSLVLLCKTTWKKLNKIKYKLKWMYSEYCNIIVSLVLLCKTTWKKLNKIKYKLKWMYSEYCNIIVSLIGYLNTFLIQIVMNEAEINNFEDSSIFLSIMWLSHLYNVS